MKYLWLVSLFLFAVTGALPAQEPLISPEMPVDYGTLHRWLHSGDPRLIAWAADFARRNHDQKILGEMPALLDADGIVKILRLPTLEEPECAASTG